MQAEQIERFGSRITLAFFAVFSTMSVSVEMGAL